MAAENPQQDSADALDERRVRDYLADNPDFFQRHPDMLRTLNIPHSSGDAVSLVERQVSVLRERNVELRHRLKDLTEAARENEDLYINTRKLLLSLLEANDLADLFKRFQKGMADDFGTSHAALIIYGQGLSEAGARCRLQEQSDVQAGIGGLLKGGGPACGALRADEFGFLFPGARGGGSAAIVPITNGALEMGLITVGSTDAARYHSQMGTLFLEHLADVVARVLPHLSGSPGAINSA